MLLENSNFVYFDLRLVKLCGHNLYTCIHISKCFHTLHFIAVNDLILRIRNKSDRMYMSLVAAINVPNRKLADTYIQNLASVSES